MRRVLLAGVLAVLVGACAEGGGGPPPKGGILAIGDSVLAWNRFRGRSIPDVVARETGMQVSNLSVSGARISHSSPQARAKGGDIREQYTPGEWDWVLLNGGANDLLFECGCRRCDATLDRMISADGAGGEIPKLVTQLRSTGAQIVLLGYYDANARANLFSRCSDTVDRLNQRVARLAERHGDVHFVSAAPAMDPANPRHWAVDRVHPSAIGADRIGQLIARKICTIRPSAKCRNPG